PNLILLTHTPAPQIYPLSLHDALPILAIATRSRQEGRGARFQAVSRSLEEQAPAVGAGLDQSQPRAIRRLSAEILSDMGYSRQRSEEHTSELQSPCNLVCRLLLEKKKK